MNSQWCEECGGHFAVSKLVEAGGMTNYPVLSRAAFCPYCGDDLAKQKERAKEKELLDSVEEVAV